MTNSAYTAEAVISDDTVADIRINIEEKVWHLWGRAGSKREADLAASVKPNTLPVLIGSGLGHCMQKLIDQGRPLVVVDKDPFIHSLTGACEQAAHHDTVLWVDDSDPKTAFEQISDWQKQHGHLPLAPVVIPLYLRLDRDYYGALANAVKTSAETDFWSRARYPKFRDAAPKVLFFDSGYFLCNEILSALDRLGNEWRSIVLDNRETGTQAFIEAILSAVIDFRPDFVLTVNHFGLDREGKLAALLNDLNLPLASWFVDNPHLILFDYAHPGSANTAIFTFDAGNLDHMRERGFEHVHYLPLATDPERFRPGLSGQTHQTWKSDVSFVGNSMTEPVARSLSRANIPDNIQESYETIARDFGLSGETRIERFLKTYHPKWHTLLGNLPTRENRLALESLLTWEATRQYRLSCVSQTLEFKPLIIGDDGWRDILPTKTAWRFLPPLDYYDELPLFYPLSKINFNCTSRQMVGAVNQRVFDVPACGGCLITDYREQMEDLFDLDSEAAIYYSVDEIPHLIEEHLTDHTKRIALANNARKRILANHTYEIRLTSLIETMRNTFR